MLTSSKFMRKRWFSALPRRRSLLPGARDLYRQWELLARVEAIQGGEFLSRMIAM